jgi:hypothetical protein
LWRPFRNDRCLSLLRQRKSEATFEAILLAHGEATRQRVAAQSRVILVQDTTEIDMTRPAAAVVGAGPLDGATRRGALLHLLHAFTPDGTPLGTVSAQAWSRPEGVGCATMTRAERAAIPIEEKESLRWVTTLAAAQDAAQACPDTQCVCVADSEADIYELLEAASAGEQHLAWIVRACQNRALQTEPEQEQAAATIRAHAAAGAELFRQQIQVRGRKALTAQEARGRRQPRESRTAEVLARAARVTLRPPHRPDRKLAAVSVNVVLVREENPPPGDEPVEWLLLTSLPIDQVEQVRQIIQCYCVRWMIEVFFRVLKSGCRVEERRFEALDRILTCLAVYLIVAWRTLYACRLGRSCPDVSCEVVFEPAEWQATWKIVRREDPPSSPPPLGVMVRLAAQLGGYVNRKRSEPGPQTLWIGMQRIHDFAICWETFGPGAKQPVQDV